MSLSKNNRNRLNRNTKTLFNKTASFYNVDFTEYALNTKENHNNIIRDIANLNCIDNLIYPELNEEYQKLYNKKKKNK